jgi:hypothetical protein
MVRKSAAARARTAAGSRGEEREEASVDGVGSGGLELLADRGWSARGSGTEGEAAKVGISLEAMTVARRESPTRQGVQEAGRRVLSPRLACDSGMAVVTVPRNGKTTRPTRHVDDELVVMFSSIKLHALTNSTQKLKLMGRGVQFTYIIFQHSPHVEPLSGYQTWNRSEQQLFYLIALARIQTHDL